MLGMRVISVSSVEVSGPPFLIAPFFPPPTEPELTVFSKLSRGILACASKNTWNQKSQARVLSETAGQMWNSLYKISTSGFLRKWNGLRCIVKLSTWITFPLDKCEYHVKHVLLLFIFFEWYVGINISIISGLMTNSLGEAVLMV